jgi:hypothetical protein
LNFKKETGSIFLIALFGISFFTLSACGGARAAHLAALEEEDVARKRLAEERLKITEPQEKSGTSEDKDGR